MDTKYKDDLFRKYVQFHEGKVDTTPSKQRPGSDESLRVAASTLLSLHKVDPFYRFRLIQFYEVVESSLRTLSASSLRALHCAFSVLETVGVNLFLYPWKKEFRSIKVRSKQPPPHCSPVCFLAPSGPSREGSCLSDLIPSLPAHPPVLSTACEIMTRTPHLACLSMSSLNWVPAPGSSHLQLGGWKGRQPSGGAGP